MDAPARVARPGGPDPTIGARSGRPLKYSWRHGRRESDVSAGDARPPGDARVWLPPALQVPSGPGGEGAHRSDPAAWSVDPTSPPTARAGLAPRARRGFGWEWLVALVCLLAIAAGAVALYRNQEAKTPAAQPQEAKTPAAQPEEAKTPAAQPRRGTTAAVKDALHELDGIPQVGSLLGRDANLPTLTVFADVAGQPYTRFEARVLPTLLREYVRPGRVKIRLRTVPGRAATSRQAARIAQAGGLQTRLWQFVVALGARQRPTARTADLAAAVRAVPALDQFRLAADRRSPRVNRAIARARREARAQHVQGPLAFRLSAGGRVVVVRSPLSARRFGAALRRALAAAPRGAE